MSEKDLKLFWDDYYKSTDRDTLIKDENFFKIELETLSKQLKKYIKTFSSKKKINIVELGSGTGAFASFLLTYLGDLSKKINFIGIDFSSSAIKIANDRKLRNCHFFDKDFFNFFLEKKKYDIIVTQRSVMAITNKSKQFKLLNLIHQSLKKSGKAIMSEATKQGLISLNQIRHKLNLNSIEDIWHCLYLDEKELKNNFNNLKIIDFSSLYWLITRAIYPFFKTPEHNTILHNVIASLIQGKGYGLVKLIVITK